MRLITFINQIFKVETTSSYLSAVPGRSHWKTLRLLTRFVHLMIACIVITHETCSNGLPNGVFLLMQIADVDKEMFIPDWCVQPFTSTLTYCANCCFVATIWLLTDWDKDGSLNVTSWIWIVLKTWNRRQKMRAWMTLCQRHLSFGTGIKKKKSIFHTDDWDHTAQCNALPGRQTSRLRRSIEHSRIKKSGKFSELSKKNWPKTAFFNLWHTVILNKLAFRRTSEIGGQAGFSGSNLNRQCHDNRWFWQQFCVGENNGGHKARLRKTTIARGKRHLRDSAFAVKLFARLTELLWSDVRDTCVSSRHFLPAQKSANYHWISWHCPFNKVFFFVV